MSVNGFLLVDKPEGPTSHDIVARVRHLIRNPQSPIINPQSSIRNIKVGHCGTLDPFASGLLILTIGKATRFSEYLLHGDKTYVFTLALGATSDTYDRTGAITACPNGKAPETLTEKNINSALQAFTGDIEQMPPIYSAIKIQGRKLYDYARAGEDVSIKPRRVTIHSLRLLSMDAPNYLQIEARVSGGTYIRSLGHDIGQCLGIGAYVCSLRRTSIGDIAAVQATAFENLESQWNEKIIPIPDVFPRWEKIVVSGERLARIKNGNFISAEKDEAIEKEKKHPLLLLDESGDVVGLAEMQESGDGVRRLIQPVKVF